MRNLGSTRGCGLGGLWVKLWQSIRNVDEINPEQDRGGDVVGSPFRAAAEGEALVVTAWGCSCQGLHAGWLNGVGEFLLLGSSGKGWEEQNCHQELEVGWEGDSELPEGAGAGPGPGVWEGAAPPVFPHPLLPPSPGEKLPEAVKPGVSTKGKK